MLDLAHIIERIKGSKRTLFILCGLPYSGKTHIATALEAATGIGTVRIDDLFHKRGYSWDDGRLPDVASWEEIFEESYAQVREYLSRGESVLYDSTNHTRASREKLREVAASVGGVAEVIYIQVSQETIWKRWEAAREDKMRPVVARELVTQTIDMLEPPMPDESVTTIVNG